MKKEFICNLCPRQCGAVRTETLGFGFCQSGIAAKVVRIAPHYWEEPCISGTRGSGTIFFSGCNLRCVYCQNYVISSKPVGQAKTPLQLAECIKSLEAENVHNINLVTPSHFISAIAEALKIYKPHIPVIYNCGGYESISSLRLLDGLVDIYLPDFKYYSSERGLRYSNAENYKETALKAVKEMVRQTGEPIFDSDGILQKGTLVRHLILPGGTDDSINVLKLLEKEFSYNILVSLMHQYYPAGIAEKYPEINRKLTSAEYNKVMNVLFDLELDGFVQEADSADSSYTPDFQI